MKSSVEDPDPTLDLASGWQEYLKRGCPHSLRGSVWAQVVYQFYYYYFQKIIPCLFLVADMNGAFFLANIYLKERET